MDFNHRDEHRDDDMLVIQANLDDMNPEHTGYITDKLLEAGANDVWWIPILMKKGRPGLMLNVLTDEEKLGAMEEIIFSETTTLGLRYMHASCHRLGRDFREVETPWGIVKVKAGYHRGRLVQFAPEFRDCEELAKASGVPLKKVYEQARAGFMRLENAEESFQD
ncbi:nickel insertion protein [Gorillibacterium massiliense]|uniref:nickel insertion protein n=1 Tax=Gorillibacterium massiliense TaxID=1280390 RepID=UPI0004BC4D58|nr:nickel insertion protein [Gorillibacterium massiliense]